MINNLLNRIKMYVMITSIENDFIENYLNKLIIEDIPETLILKAKENKLKENNLESILRALDIQSYIEIFNANIIKLKANKEEKSFINENLSKTIGIRNKIMHPRLLEFYDFPILNECFIKIKDYLKSFVWTNVTYAINNILPNNEELLKLEYKINLKKSQTIIENLPQDVDFEETSFIGRKKEIGEIKEKLFKKNVHVLSIIGEGGVGKTSTTIKLLYELLDEERQPFNLILWTSLKTKTLNNYEFEKIENAITTTTGMYNDLYNVVGGTKDLDTKEYLIKLSEDFDILLVLDNLETINSEEIKDFLSRFTENAKVIITSRIGLGEMETRYKLSGLNDDDVLDYFNALLELYGCENYFSKEEKFHYAKNELHSNPLAIKWFVRTLSTKKDIKEILEHKNDVIDFCMSNVYEQLSEDSKKLLNVLTVSNKALTIGELFYYLEAENGNETSIRKAINDLINSSFIEQSIFNEESLISISDFAKEFLLKIEKFDQTKLNNKQKDLFAFEQNMIIDFNTDPYNIKNHKFDVTERHKIISSLYLRKALEAFYVKDSTTYSTLLDLARRISPNYYACNIVSAFINSSTNPQKSIEEYSIALNNTSTMNETRLIYIHYAKFLLSINDYDGAIEKLERAELIKTDNYTIFEKSKILACCGRFDEAYKSLFRIAFDDIKENDKVRNLYHVRLSDIKRREADRVDARDINLRLEKYFEAIEIIEKELLPDKDTLNYVALLLNNLYHVVINKQVMQIILEKIEKYKYDIFKTANFKLLRKNIRNDKNYLPDFEGKHTLLTYIFDVNSELQNLKENEAIVSNVKENFGFVKNYEYPQGIYFSRKSLDFEPKIGDIVELGEVIEVKQGLTVLSIKYITNIIDKYNI